jgi:hypothetical integral membrane protein (TIGR02206 family)
MSQYFAYEYTGNPFVLFGTWHIVALLLILLLIVAIPSFRNISKKTRKPVRWTMAAILWTNEIFWHIWNIYWGQWSIQTMLPLHICSILVWLTGFMLISKNYRIYEFAYFIGIGGAVQALLTPDAGIYGFPHYRFFQTMISHGLLITAAIYMTIIENFRPTWKSFWRVIIGVNLYAAIIFPINRVLNTNYLFINGKPATASILDALPAWPYYILYMELIGFIIFFLLYLPFYIKDIKSNKKKLKNHAT